MDVHSIHGLKVHLHWVDSSLVLWVAQEEKRSSSPGSVHDHEITASSMVIAAFLYVCVCVCVF